MSKFVLPSLEVLEIQKDLEIRDFVPRKHVPSDRPSSQNNTVDDLSLWWLEAISYLQLKYFVPCQEISVIAMSWVFSLMV